MRYTMSVGKQIGSQLNRYEFVIFGDEMVVAREGNFLTAAKARKAGLVKAEEIQQTVSGQTTGIRFYYPGDAIQDLTFDPPLNGVVVKSHKYPDAYYVRLEGAWNDSIIHARNLKMREV